MRKFKKYIIVVLALVLVSPILIFCLTNIGNTAGVPMLDFGVITITENSDGVFIAYDEDTISEVIVRPVFGDSAVGVTGAFARMAVFFENEVGFSCSLTMVVFSYVIYMTIVFMSFLVYDVIVFIPRKCSEFLEGNI